MAKNRFNIKPKLGGTGVKPKKLPVQNISVEQIEQIAIQKKAAIKKDSTPTVKEATPKKVKKEIKEAPATKAASNKKSSTPSAKQKKKPQGRPPRTEAVKRLSSDLPAHLYDKVKEEVRMNGYSLNGFLAKVIREHFDRKENK